MRTIKLIFWGWMLGVPALSLAAPVLGERELDGGLFAFVGPYLYEAHAGIVINGHMSPFVACPAVTDAFGGAAPRAMKAVEFLGVQMEQIAGVSHQGA